MFCPNCSSIYPEKIEFCTKCGVKLRTENVIKKDMRCPYCGVLISSSEFKCKNCGEILDESYPGKISSKLRLMKDIPQDLKNFKWDDRFVRTNLVIIVGIMGLVIIIMLIMNTY